MRTLPAGSVAVLVELAEDPDVRALLAQHGLNAADLPRLHGAHAGHLEREPADWYHRLSQRGHGDDPVERFLGILRSADCAAHQLLEAVGIPVGRLRKEVFDHLRQRPKATTPRPTRQTSHAPGPAKQRFARQRPAPAQSELQPQAQVDARTEAAPYDAAPAADRAPRRALAAIDPDKLPPMHGRERELAVLADALLRRGVRPPILVGERGAGRSLLARHLARVLDRPVFRLRASQYDDDELLREDFEHVQRAGGVAVFDDLDKMGSDQPPPFLPALARAWAESRPPTVTVASHETRARLATWMPGVLDGLDVIDLDPAPERDVLAAVKATAPALLASHGLALADDTNLVDLTRAADRFLVGLAMPGRALDLLDLACARSVREGEKVVHADTWMRIICERTGLPRNRIEGSGHHDVLELETQLARQVVGHEAVLETLSNLIRRNRAGFSSGRPIATTLLLGPSGVGKTEIAKALASALFDRDDALLRLDMSEYSESHAVARVVGAPPGYVGHEAGGALTDPMIAQPHRVVLLDEIEKAHRDVHQLLLQVLDEGRLTDGRGRTVDFRHSVLVMTSNLGARLVERDDDAVEDLEVLDAAREAFPVELWNRIEAPLVLRPLDTAALAKICTRLAKASSDRLLAERGIAYQLDAKAVNLLVELAGHDRALGARPLRHMLTRRVEAMLADEILRGRIRAGSRVTVGRKGDELVVTRLG